MSKGRPCPWVNTPRPWAALGTVCKQHREFTFVFQRRHSLRWSSTGPSGDHFSCSWNPDPESSQGTGARHAHTHTPGTLRTQSASVLRARDFPSQNTQQTFYASLPQMAQEPQKTKKKKCQTTAQKGWERTHVFPESDHLLGNLSPWKCFSTKKCDKRVFLPVSERGVG